MNFHVRMMSPDARVFYYSRFLLYAQKLSIVICWVYLILHYHALACAEQPDDFECTMSVSAANLKMLTIYVMIFCWGATAIANDITCGSPAAMFQSFSRDISTCQSTFASIYLKFSLPEDSFVAWWVLFNIESLIIGVVLRSLRPIYRLHYAKWHYM